MKKVKPAANPAAFVKALKGWRLQLVRSLCAGVRAAARFDEAIKWGNLAFFSNGPAVVIRAEDERILFIFLRGKRLLPIEPRLKASGRYELATLELREGATIEAKQIRRLAREAASLNRKLGDPTKGAIKP